MNLGIGYDAGALGLHWHNEESDTEYAPDKAYAFIPLSSTSGGQASFNVITGGHQHDNWGFTAAGVYELTFTVSGVLVGDSEPITDTATYSFAVGTAIPESSAVAALAGFAILGLAVIRRRRHA